MCTAVSPVVESSLPAPLLTLEKTVVESQTLTLKRNIVAVYALILSAHINASGNELFLI